MIRGLFTLLSFISVILFPWLLTVLLTLGVSIFEPLVPLAIGIFADTLYYTPQAGALPLFAIYGAIVTALSFLVRSQLKTSIIGR
jgi:hypothetical protein